MGTKGIRVMWLTENIYIRDISTSFFNNNNDI